jgi:hypothetical protein
MTESISNADIGQTSPDTNSDIKPVVQPDVTLPLSPETIQHQKDIINALRDAEEAAEQAGQREPFKEGEKNLFTLIYALGQIENKNRR